MSLNQKLDKWVKDMADLCTPDAIHWCDGSQKEYDALCELMVKGGTFTSSMNKNGPIVIIAGPTLPTSPASKIAPLFAPQARRRRPHQ